LTPGSRVDLSWTSFVTAWLICIIAAVVISSGMSGAVSRGLQRLQHRIEITMSTKAAN
jgi:hypothetical protein